MPVALTFTHRGLHASFQSWLGFGYVSVFSMFLGFLAWYHGLAIGGVARVGQVQLLQPFLTLLFSAVLLHESISPLTIGTAFVVVAMVALGKKAPIAHFRHT